MKRTEHGITDRLLFRLDFALRGHGAYTDPADLAALVALVEETRRLLGAPLLRYAENEYSNAAGLAPTTACNPIPAAFAKVRGNKFRHVAADVSK